MKEKLFENVEGNQFRLNEVDSSQNMGPSVDAKVSFKGSVIYISLQRPGDGGEVVIPLQLTPQQVQLVQQRFKAVKPQQQTAQGQSKAPVTAPSGMAAG